MLVGIPSARAIINYIKSISKSILLVLLAMDYEFTTNLLLTHFDLYAQYTIHNTQYTIHYENLHRGSIKTNQKFFCSENLFT